MKTISINTLNFVRLLLVTTSLFAQTETRNINSFDGLDVAGHYDVILTQGKEGNLTLKGDKDDLKQIETYVKNDILIIKQKKTSWLGSWGNNSGKITINVPVESIDKVVLSGSGSINARHQLTSRNFDVMLSGSGKINLNLVTDNFEGTLTGSGNIKLQGKATNAAYQLTGSGDFEAKFFETTNGLAKITGSGDIEMNASSKINAQITGSGDIICHGNPDIQKTNTTGSGDVKIIN